MGPKMILPEYSIIAVLGCSIVGVKILFRVALVLLRHCTSHLRKMPYEIHDLLNCLRTRNMPEEILQPEFLVREVMSRTRAGLAVCCNKCCLQCVCVCTVIGSSCFTCCSIILWIKLILLPQYCAIEYRMFREVELNIRNICIKP